MTLTRRPVKKNESDSQVRAIVHIYTHSHTKRSVKAPVR